MTALIDADSIVYIIAWNYREAGNESDVRKSCDTFLSDILTITQSDDYIGVFSPPRNNTFRFDVYNYAPYKGTRPPKTESIELWEKIIKDHYSNHHGFITHEVLEADDIVAGVSHEWQIWPQFAGQKDSRFKVPHIICSPDKDLNQVPGFHYDYRAKTSETSIPQIIDIDTDEAYWMFWTQMLTGDSNDNVAGIPGLGPVKVKKIIDELKEQGDKVQARSTVLQQYRKYFGTYYGHIIFQETEKTLRLMTPYHPLYSIFSSYIKECADNTKRTLRKSEGFFDIMS